ncbi:hypothetical protein EB796_003886 [Bugula neritina]|uniref:Uncharacterized protein n=1 Tax=Bugula neritina TaxID=10212 RepID=A0A7J7KHU1_BUGNE|nr:hypothetical protein EB796_003886 [Bugula neritina]
MNKAYRYYVGMKKAKSLELRNKPRKKIPFPEEELKLHTWTHFLLRNSIVRMKVIAILLAVCLALVAASYHNNYNRYRSYRPSSYRRYNSYNRRYNSYKPYNRRYNYGSYRPKYSSYYGKY